MTARVALRFPLVRDLALEDVALYSDVGRQRTLRALELHRQHRAGAKHEWNRDLGGAGAELVIARVLERPWEDTPEPDYDGDVGPGVQVRWTQLAHGCLPIHPGPPYDRWGRADPDLHVFFLVTGGPVRFNVCGWIEGWEGKQPEFWRGDLDNPCFLVPQSKLHTHDPELPEWP